MANTVTHTGDIDKQAGAAHTEAGQQHARSDVHSGANKQSHAGLRTRQSFHRHEEKTGKRLRDETHFFHARQFQEQFPSLN